MIQGDIHMEMLNDTIRNAFKSLEDIDVIIEPISKAALMEAVDEEPAEDESGKTVRELFEKEGSYIMTKEFEADGGKYFLFMEATNGGESCDITFDTFDVNNIEDVLFEVLDEDNNFVDELHDDGLGLESTFGDAVSAATTQLNGGETEAEPTETETKTDAEADPDNEDENVRDYVSPEGEGEGEPKPEDTLPPAEAEMEPVEMTDATAPEETQTEALGKDKKYIKTRNSPVDAVDLADELDIQGIKYEMADDGLFVAAKDYEFALGRLEQLEMDGYDDYDESLGESQKFNIQDEQEMKKAEEILDDKKTEDPVEVVVDIDAETIDQLAKDNTGSFIFNCTQCGNSILRTLDQLRDPGYDKEPDPNPAHAGKFIYKLKDPNNAEDYVSCPECHNCNTFLGGKRIEAVDIDAEVSGETTPEPSTPAEPEPTEEPKEPEEAKQEPDKMPEMPQERKDEGYTELKLESFDEKGYDRIVNRYLRENYANVKSYMTTDAAIDDQGNKIMLEGIIKFKSGKEKPTKFVFEAKEVTKKKHIKFVGVNETFSKSKAYTLIGTVADKRLISESLSYRYDAGDRKVKGKVEPFRKR